MPRAHHVLAFALSLAAAGPAMAAPCAGFSDVDNAEAFCPAVEWLRNRAVTTGCTTTEYCPTSPVTRAAMALFMNRLGTALTPQLAFVEASLGAVDPDDPPVLCQTALSAAAAYPRQALVSVSFAGASAGDLGYAARPMVSFDGGTWQPLGAVAIRDSVAGAAWVNTSTAGTVAIPALQTARFGVRVVRESGASDFTSARCQVVAGVMNANGTSSPFDMAAAP